MESSIGAFIPGGPGVGGTTALVFHAVGLRLSGRQATWPCGQADGLGQGGVPAGEVAIISKPTPHGPVDARPAKRRSRARVTRATPSTPPSHLWIPNGRAAIVPALHPPAHRLAHRCSCAGSYGRPVGAATWALLATEPRGRWKIPHSMAFLASAVPLPCLCRAPAVPCGALGMPRLPTAKPPLPYRRRLWQPTKQVRRQHQKPSRSICAISQLRPTLHLTCSVSAGALSADPRQATPPQA